MNDLNFLTFNLLTFDQVPIVELYFNLIDKLYIKSVFVNRYLENLSGTCRVL